MPLGSTRCGLRACCRTTSKLITGVLSIVKAARRRLARPREEGHSFRDRLLLRPAPLRAEGTAIYQNSESDPLN
jgi:hypothetical protein